MALTQISLIRRKNNKVPCCIGSLFLVSELIRAAFVQLHPARNSLSLYRIYASPDVFCLGAHRVGIEATLFGTFILRTIGGEFQIALKITFVTNILLCNH